MNQQKTFLDKVHIDDAKEDTGVVEKFKTSYAFENVDNEDEVDTFKYVPIRDPVRLERRRAYKEQSKSRDVTPTRAVLNESAINPTIRYVQETQSSGTNATQSSDSRSPSKRRLKHGTTIKYLRCMYCIRLCFCGLWWDRRGHVYYKRRLAQQCKKGKASVPKKETKPCSYKDGVGSLCTCLDPDGKKPKVWPEQLLTVKMKKRERRKLKLKNKKERKKNKKGKKDKKDKKDKKNKKNKKKPKKPKKRKKMKGEDSEKLIAKHSYGSRKSLKSTKSRASRMSMKGNRKSLKSMKTSESCKTLTSHDPGYSCPTPGDKLCMRPSCKTPAPPEQSAGPDKALKPMASMMLTGDDDSQKSETFKEPQLSAESFTAVKEEDACACTEELWDTISKQSTSKKNSKASKSSKASKTSKSSKASKKSKASKASKSSKGSKSSKKSKTSKTSNKQKPAKKDSSGGKFGCCGSSQTKVKGKSKKDKTASEILCGCDQETSRFGPERELASSSRKSLKSNKSQAAGTTGSYERPCGCTEDDIWTTVKPEPEWESESEWQSEPEPEPKPKKNMEAQISLAGPADEPQGAESSCGLLSVPCGCSSQSPSAGGGAGHGGARKSVKDTLSRMSMGVINARKSIKDAFARKSMGGGAGHGGGRKSVKDALSRMSMGVVNARKSIKDAFARKSMGGGAGHGREGAGHGGARKSVKDALSRMSMGVVNARKSIKDAFARKSMGGEAGHGGGGAGHGGARKSVKDALSRMSMGVINARKSIKDAFARKSMGGGAEHGGGRKSVKDILSRMSMGVTNARKSMKDAFARKSMGGGAGHGGGRKSMGGGAGHGGARKSVKDILSRMSMGVTNARKSMKDAFARKSMGGGAGHGGGRKSMGGGAGHGGARKSVKDMLSRMSMGVANARKSMKDAFARKSMGGGAAGARKSLKEIFTRKSGVKEQSIIPQKKASRKSEFKLKGIDELSKITGPQKLTLKQKWDYGVGKRVGRQMARKTRKELGLPRWEPERRSSALSQHGCAICCRKCKKVFFKPRNECGNLKKCQGCEPENCDNLKCCYSESALAKKKKKKKKNNNRSKSANDKPSKRHWWESKVCKGCKSTSCPKMRCNNSISECGYNKAKSTTNIGAKKSRASARSKSVGAKPNKSMNKNKKNKNKNKSNKNKSNNKKNKNKKKESRMSKKSMKKMYARRRRYSDSSISSISSNSSNSSNSSMESLEPRRSSTASEIVLSHQKRSKHPKRDCASEESFDKLIRIERLDETPVMSEEIFSVSVVNVRNCDVLESGSKHQHSKLRRAKVMNRMQNREYVPKLRIDRTISASASLESSYKPFKRLHTKRRRNASVGHK